MSSFSAIAGETGDVSWLFSKEIVKADRVIAILILILFDDFLIELLLGEGSG